MGGVLARQTDTNPSLSTTAATTATTTTATKNSTLVSKQTQGEVRDEEGYTQLMQAAKEGNVKDVCFLLEKGADTEANDPVFGTALTVAAVEGKIDVVKVLVEQKANLEFATQDLGYTPLLAACQMGHTHVIELLLRLRANVNAATKGGLTCLMLLAASDPPLTSVLSLLLSHTAQIDARNEYGMTALTIAAKNGHVSLVKLLVEAKADVRAKDKEGVCAMQMASSSPAIKEILYTAKAQSKQAQEEETIHTLYEMHEVLGEGTYGKVKKAVRKKDRTHFAAKIIKMENLSASELSSIDAEVAIMRLVNHENCVRLEEVFQTAKKTYLVLELCTGDYHEKLVREGPLCEKEAKLVITSTARALQYLHTLGIAHRDLKLENVMIGENNSVKISDFGFAKRIQNAGDTMRTTCGTPTYAAPEVLSANGYGVAADLWSLGVILYLLLSGFPPFHHTNIPTLYVIIKKGEFTFAASQWETISDAAKDLIRSLLVLDPNQRATPSQVLEHPWLSTLEPGVTIHLG